MRKMDFEFNEEQKIWQKTINDFVEREAGREYYRKCDMERRFPYELYDKMTKQGWMSIFIPEKYGGQEMGVIMFCIAMEALGKYGYDIASGFAGPAFTALNIVHHGSEEQKNYYLPRFVRGEIRFSFSLTEPDAGSDADRARCARAVENGVLLRRAGGCYARSGRFGRHLHS